MEAIVGRMQVPEKADFAGIDLPRSSKRRDCNHFANVGGENSVDKHGRNYNARYLLYAVSRATKGPPRPKL